MKAEIRNLVDISRSAAALRGRADVMLENAKWASHVFERFDRNATMRVVDSVAAAAHEGASRFAELAVEESGFGVVAHKRIKNELTAMPLVGYYREDDYVNPRIDEKKKIVEIPRPAGVIFALTPSTNPISTLNYKILLAMMTRNAIVISPHPAVKNCCVAAAAALSSAASEAGAPASCIQVLEDPSIPLVNEFMQSPKTSVILATGGSAMVRAAYASSNPAIGVGPGNAPVFVDSSADLGKASDRIVESKSFDNSVLCTNESVLITLPEVDPRLRRALQSKGAHFCEEDETERLRRFLFHAGGFNVEAIGRDAGWIANQAGISVRRATRILVAPISKIGVEEELSKEKLCPVLAYHVAKNRPQAISQARAVLRLAGAGHTAAVHASDEQAAFDFACSVESYRVVVNAPCSQGAAGFGTHLAPSFTVGTGYFGRSSIGENIGPQHLVHWTKLAYSSENSEAFGIYDGVSARFEGPLPQAPEDGVPGKSRYRAPPVGNVAAGGIDREELRRIIAEELRAVLKG
ncbi:MAG: aldehyde dehydrogenase family protein [Albidovulum sp.]|nr:aldehyde dehydrogenase family protein [Albidovulum sp.]